MKKLLAILLCIATLISASGIYALAGNYTFITVEKDSGNVSFDADFAEIGVPIKVEVSGAEDETFIYRWYIDGIRIENDGAVYTPIESDMQSMISVDVFDVKGNAVGNANMFVSSIPVVYIETEDRRPVASKEDYINADIKIQGNAQYNSADILYEGKTQIRGRGNSTWNADKKPYRLKLDSKADLFGMGKNKHWVLISNPFDSSLLRNHLSYNLAADMGLESQKSVWVDLVFNGTPVGNYQLCEHIRVGENRVDITNWEDLAEDAAKAIYNENKASMTKDERDELIDIMAEDMSWTTSDTVEYNGVTYTVSDYIDVPDINGGYLLEVVRMADEYTFETTNGSRICVDTPEVLSEEMLSSVQGYYQAFEDALFADDFCTVYNGETMRYTDFIDVESFAKGLLVNELFENYDFGKTSTWISKEVDGKLVYGPVWDMDYTTPTTTYRWTSLNTSWLKRLLSDPVFLQELREIYFEYRYTAIQDLVKDGGDIDTSMEMISSSAKHNDYLWYNEISAEENSLDLKLRLQAKINWFDSILKDIPSAYTSMTSVPNKEFVSSTKLTCTFDKAENILNVTTKGTTPALVKIFADGKLCDEFVPTQNSTDVTLSSFADGAVITVVCYDENSDVLFGSYCLTGKEITALTASGIPDSTYNAGDTLGLDSIELTAKYSDGTTQTVEPELVYTYVKDAIGDQFFSYGKVTQEIGKTFVVLRYGNVCTEFEIQINPRENHKEVIEMIKKLPKEIVGNRFVDELFKAQIAYDALTETSKAKVTNYSKLSNLMAGLADTESVSTGIVACVADGVFRTNARSSLIIVSNGAPSKIIFTGESGSTTTYTDSSPAYLYKKKVGDYTVSTIRHMISEDANHRLQISPVYGDLHKTETFKIKISDIMDETKALDGVRYVDWINEGDVYKIRVFRDANVKTFALYEDGSAVKFKMKDNGSTVTIMPELTTPGKHTLLLRYSYGNSSLDYGNIEVFVREYNEDTERIYDVDYPAESYAKTVDVDITTSADVEKLELVCGEVKVEPTSTVNGDFKLWSAEIDITDSKEYVLYMNSQATQTVIAPKLLDPLLVEGTKLVKFLADTPTAEIPAYITEIADDAFDGFNGTIYCYPGSAAEEFAKANGIDCQVFDISINVTEININSGESFTPEVAVSPYIPDDFTLEAVYNEEVISFDGGTITALQPGYTRLILSVANSSFEHTVYVYVGGGPRKADVNADGKINSLDALKILQASVGTEILDESQMKAADINADGKINSLDALIVLQISTQEKSIWDYI